MKLASYVHGGQTRLGAVSGDAVIDLNRADPTVPGDVLDFLAAGAPAIDAATAAIARVEALDPESASDEQLRTPLADVTLLCPVPTPPKIICVARNYAEHAKEAGLEISEVPILFARFAAGLVAQGEPIVRPAVSDQLDWEGELAVVIGTGGRNVPLADALDHVAGYSIFNDVTVRDFQFRTTQYTVGKNFQATGPFGPYLVLKDEIPDPAALSITTHVDDELMQEGDTADMLFDVATIVSHISEFIQLEPGDVIPMGTPSGVGFKRNPPRFLRPGETVKVEIPGVGTLENPVIDESETR